MQNFNAAPARDVTFRFSEPAEDSGGFVLSDQPYLKKGLPFLAPEERIASFWDTLPTLAKQMREKGLDDGIAVTTRYRDLAGESYGTKWNLNPLLFEGARIGSSRGMDALVGPVRELSEEERVDGHGRDPGGAATGPPGDGQAS